ncbi:zinc finger and SCAN domain-containing protein 31-like [Armigeres subalbatus]|uniref:zinc finger and SCAN domain-containing protein 31-like n=1 Tax=Armigeres subalbatus TaxID=124917 RepID=UPI002ED1BBCF
MSLTRIKTLVENYSKLCRFCLTINPDDLSPLFDRMVGKTDIFTINAIVREVLTTLGIQFAQNDAYPNRICGNCRDLLHTIQHFRETAQESIQLLDRARLLKEFPSARFDDDPPVAVIVKENYEIQEPELDVVYEELVGTCKEEDEPETPEVKLDQPDQLESVGPAQDDENINTKIEPEYTEMEWVVLDEGEVESHQEEETTHETVSHQEDVYVDEEYIVDEADQPSETSESSNIQHEQEKEEEVHVEPKEPYTKPPRMCPICGATSTAMKVHMRTHSNVRPFPCDKCEKKFYTNAKLRSHIDSVHIGERKFSCEVCGKAFVLRKTLNAHMLSHAAEKDFVCSICSKGFLFRWALVKHERVHTGERPYECTLDGCGKRFATSSNLKQHQKTNTHYKNPREDVCQHCNKLFQNKYALRAHMKTHEVKVEVVDDAQV